MGINDVSISRLNRRCFINLSYRLRKSCFSWPSGTCFFRDSNIIPFQTKNTVKDIQNIVHSIDSILFNSSVHQTTLFSIDASKRSNMKYPNRSLGYFWLIQNDILLSLILSALIARIAIDRIAKNLLVLMAIIRAMLESRFIKF